MDKATYVVDESHQDVVATRPDGAAITLFDRRLCFHMPATKMFVSTESLENRRVLHIAKAAFFDNYLGVGYTYKQAVDASLDACIRVLERFSKESTLRSYLQDIGFEFTPWGACVNMDLCYYSAYIKLR